MFSPAIFANGGHMALTTYWQTLALQIGVLRNPNEMAQ
jgi:hypothetical protein